MAHAFGYLICRRSAGSPDPALQPALRALAFLLVAFVCAPWALGQTPREQAVRFTVFSARPIAELAFVSRANAVPQKIVFYPTARSPRYEYRGAMPLRFVDARGVVVAEAAIPAEMRDVLLLFMPLAEPPAATKADAKSAPLRYQVAVLDDGAVRHGSGGLAIINLSGLALAGTVGTENVTLKAGLNPTLAIGPSAKIMLRTTANNRSYQAYADTVQLARNERALLILFPPFYQGSLEVQSRLLVDQPPAAK